MASSIHWLAPASMLAALLAGILFALAHHVFYQALNGTAVPQTDYTLNAGGLSTNVSRQQLTLALGTAFAFATKSCLVIAVSIAWVQCFWRTLTTRSSGKPLTLDNVNTAFAVIHNAFTLVSPAGWRRFSSLFVLALVTWLLPIAAIITPATLTIQARIISPPPTEALLVPSIRFDVLSYLDSMNPMNPEQDTYMYTGPSHAVKRVAAAVSAQGSALNFVPPASNASWTSSFQGPVLRCENLSASEQLAVQGNIATWLLKNNTNESEVSHCAQPRSYQTWYGRFPYDAADRFGDNENASLHASTVGPKDLDGTGAAFRLAVFPKMYRYSEAVPGLPLVCLYETLNRNASAPLDDLADDSTMLECKLSRSTYHVDFNFTSGRQSIDISVPVTDRDTPSLFANAAIGPNNASCAGLEPSPWNNSSRPDDKLSSCNFNGTVIEELSYLAVMDSVLNLLSGDIGLAGFWTNVSSRVIDTVFMNTNELEFLAHDAIGYKGASLQSALRDNGRGDFVGLGDAANFGQQDLPLMRVIEEVFQNVTVSLTSLDQFQASSPPRTEVTKITYRNVYIYTKYKLWLAYGAAIACASVAVSVGLYTIFSTGASYSSDFSTILRAARGAALSNEVDLSDANGKDPLPKYLAKTSIAVSAARGKSSGDDEESKQLRSVAGFGQTTTYASSDAFVAASERRTSPDREADSLQWETELHDLSPDTNVDGSHSPGR